MRTFDSLDAAKAAALRALPAYRLAIFKSVGLEADYALACAHIDALACPAAGDEGYAWLEQVECCVALPARPWPTPVGAMVQVPAALVAELVALAEVARCKVILRDRARVLLTRQRAAMVGRPLLSLVPPPAPLVAHEGPVGSFGGLSAEEGSDAGIYGGPAVHASTVRPESGPGEVRR